MFTLRLIPLFPFFIVNLVMGLTTVSIRTYWWVSQIGMLPVTMVNSYAGSTLPSLSELMENGVSGLSPQLYIAFTILGLFPIATKRLLERWRAGFQP